LPCLAGDPLRLRQILVNLVDHAVKFTAEGEVVVRAAYVEPAAGLMLEVTDTGMGIPEAKRQDIFQAFTQADSSITRKHGGTGLVLASAVSSPCSWAAASRSRVASDAGAPLGSHCPCPAPPSPPRVEGRVHYSGSARRPALAILLAEDNPVNQAVARRQLERLGCDAVIAPNGAQASSAWARAASIWCSWTARCPR
jgi:hypothetical protein